MIAAASHPDGCLVERPARPALGGPGKRTLSYADAIAIRDRAVLVMIRDGFTNTEIATAFDCTPRWVAKRKAHLRRLAAAHGVGGFGGDA